MAVAHETLPLSIRELQRTREPLERATALPRAAFTDPRVLEWELDHLFRGGWICAGHVDQVRERGDYLMVEIGGESVIVVADDDGLPRAFLNTCRHRGARLVQDRGPRRARAVPLPRVDLRLRRLAAQRAVHRRARGLRPALLRPARRAPRGRRGPRPARPLRRRAVAGRARRRPGARASPATASTTCAARSGSSTTSTPTGRRSPRTTASACTARACTRSSTGSPTTSRARRSTGAGAWCGGSMTLREGVETMAARRRRPRAAADRRPHRGGPALDPLLPAVPEHARLAAPRLRDAAHAVAARARPHRGRLRVVLRAGDDGGRGLRPLRRGRASGTRSTARTGTSASSRSTAWPRAGSRPAATRRRRATCTPST